MSPSERTLRPPAFIGPHFTTYRDEKHQEVTLTYKKRLDQHLSMKAVFVAEAKAAHDIEPAQVVVKFAYKYNREAHRLLEAAKQAPRLRHCEYEPSVGLWVVVMDYVEHGVVLGENQRLTEPSHIHSLRAAVQNLHRVGFVFGDLRRPNVLVVDDKVVLIDFDWCGQVGEARYPSDIALDGMQWRGDVARGASTLLYVPIH